MKCVFLVVFKWLLYNLQVLKDLPLIPSPQRIKIIVWNTELLRNYFIAIIVKKISICFGYRWKCREWVFFFFFFLRMSFLTNQWLHLHDFGLLEQIQFQALREMLSVQFSSVAQSCLTLCDPLNLSTPGLPVHHQLLEFTQTHSHQVGDAIQPSHPLLSPSPPAPNPSQHQGLFQWVNSSHQVAKLLEFQLQHQSFQWTPRTDLL